MKHDMNIVNTLIYHMSIYDITQPRSHDLRVAKLGFRTTAVTLKSLCPLTTQLFFFFIIPSISLFDFFWFFFNPYVFYLFCRFLFQEYFTYNIQ